MGVMTTSISSLGFATGLLCVGLFAVGEGGCAALNGGVQPSGGHRSTASVAVTLSPVRRPHRPAPYLLPRDARRVSTSSQLRAALSDGRQEAIVLAPGVYGSSEPFDDHEGDSIYAARLGRAVLRAGISIGGNTTPTGAVIRGLKFDIKNPRKTLDGDAVHVWGSASDAAVLDTSIDGHGVLDAGVVVHQPNGFVARRVVARDFLNYGVVVDPNNAGFTTTHPYSLRDLIISHVSRKPPGSSNGTAEACLWLGSPGVAQRVSVRHCAISGIWTGTAMKHSRIQDATIDHAPVGIYIEHFTTATTFQRIRIGPSVRRGVNAEWANPALGGKPASVDNVIENAYFQTTHVGVYLDKGTTRTIVRRSVFVDQDWAAIGDYLGVDNRFYDNDFDRIAQSAVPVSYAHDTAGSGGR
jgi:hypothetical protein